MPSGSALPKKTSDLSRLTPGERLWLWRKSESSKSKSRRGVSVNSPAESSSSVPRNQLEAASSLGLDTAAYWAAENDRLDPEKVEEILRSVEEPPYTLVAALRVARRRSHLSLTQVANAAGVGSKPTFYKLEGAGDSRVTEFWKSQGFMFPKDLT